MPFKTIWESAGIVTEYYGVVDSGEVLEADKVFYEDPRSDTAKYQIADFSNAQPGKVVDDHITQIVGLDAGASISVPNLKVAFVTRDEHVKSLCQQYIDLSLQLNKTWTFKIFEDIGSARDWVS